ncbi:MAG: macro domain-containing protein [Peptococcaceae bacterium]|jgi:O-acetyl-ADP-ribose deacetylase (regulator of RNase III)|nr:macro domain-containing protein [Peptococcaceae bacterium]
MPFTIVRQDITKLKADAVVNAANTDLAMGGGVCGAIFKAAGAARLQAACDELSPIMTGEAVVTPGFALPAKYIVHAAGPIYRGGGHGEEKLLRAAYTNALKRAVENNCGSIAFPLISSGVYGYPKDEALQVAVSAIQDFLAGHDIDVTLAVFDKSAFTVGRELLGAVKSYIDEHYVDTYQTQRRLLDAERDALSDKGVVSDNAPIKMLINLPMPAPKTLEQKPTPAGGAPVFEPTAGAPPPLDDLVANLDEPFSRTLFQLIDAKGKTDVEVYKRANLDRKLFSKIRTGKGYTPSKKTVLALAVALELSLSETDDLLERAGYALSHAVKFDVIVEFFITSGKYNVFEINEVLFEYDQPLLGG